jgi:hypothetical protein
VKLNDETRTRLLVPMTLTQDPTGSTIELKIDAAWYSCTWQGTPVQSGGLWTQTARTTGFFAGPLHAAPAGATVLTTGRHTTETRVAWPGGDTIADRSSPIDVA